MKVITYLTFILTVVFGSSLSAFSQEPSKKSDYRLVKDDVSYESGIKTYLNDYAFKGVPVKTIEKYFSGRTEQNNGLVEISKHYEGCGTGIILLNSAGKIVGKKIVCENAKLKIYVIAYSYFDSLNKVNIILADSQKVVEDFTKGICPYAYHLYGDFECRGLDD